MNFFLPLTFIPWADGLYKRLPFRHGDKVESLNHKQTQSSAWKSSSNTITWILPLDTQTIVLPHPVEPSSLHVTFNEPALIVTLLFQLLKASLYIGHSLRSPEAKYFLVTFLWILGRRLVSLNGDSCLSATEEAVRQICLIVLVFWLQLARSNSQTPPSTSPAATRETTATRALIVWESYCHCIKI